MTLASPLFVGYVPLGLVSRSGEEQTDVFCVFLLPVLHLPHCTAYCVVKPARVGSCSLTDVCLDFALVRVSLVLLILEST